MIRLVWCYTPNPLGETAQRKFNSLDECRMYIAAGNIPEETAGYTAYDTGGSVPTALIDYRREMFA